jgi:hypothetical protein
MGASRSLLLMVAGAAGATAGLVASPGAYGALRRRLGLEIGREHFESDFAPPPPGELATEEAGPSGTDLRLSLRARLAQDTDADGAEQTGGAAPSAGARDRLRQARERLEAKTAAASAVVDAPGDPDVLEDDTADLALPGDAASR